jgi:hypothetical protein
VDSRRAIRDAGRVPILGSPPGRWPPRFFTIIMPVIGVALVTFLTVNWIRARKAREQAQPSDRNR